MEVLMSMITDECNCFLDYVDNVVEFLPKPNNLTACTRLSIRFEFTIVDLTNSCGQPIGSFTQHAKCVAPIIRVFQWQDKTCLPPCSSFSFHQESIQYVKISDVYMKKMRARYDNEVRLTSMVVSLAEQTNKEYKEEPLYPFEQFLAEVGGTSGLFLGLRYGTD